MQDSDEAIDIVYKAKKMCEMVDVLNTDLSLWIGTDDLYCMYCYLFCALYQDVDTNR